MIRIAICEDDPAAASLCRTYIERYEHEAGTPCSIRTFTDAVNFLDAFHAGAFDLIFMDIQMPVLNGLDAAKMLRKTDPAVILVFVTDLKNHAVDGYTVDAMDYIVKPMNYLKFSVVMKRAERRVQKKSEELFLTSGGDAFRVAVEDILYVEVDRNRCFYHTADGVIEIWSSLKKEKERLKAYPFALANSCYLVNLAHIKGITGDTVRVGNEGLAISRSKRRELMEAFAAYVTRNNL